MIKIKFLQQSIKESETGNGDKKFVTGTVPNLIPEMHENWSLFWSTKNLDLIARILERALIKF